MESPRLTLKRHLRTLTDLVNATDGLKEAWAAARRSGEWIRFAWKGRPAPSDAVLIVGSGRSGTTWLMYILAAVPGMLEIFEPLNPRRVPEVDALTGWSADSVISRSYYLRPGDDDPAWHDLLERILRGQVRNYWTDYTRSTFWPERFLIKLIRANLMLGYLYDHFQPAIVYIRRHPCAVVLSRLQRGWQASVQDILRQEALVEDHLRPWLPEIEREADLLGAHAVWWAVENYVADHDLSTRPHCALCYEEMVLAPAETLARICSWLDVPVPRDWQKRAQTPVPHSRHLQANARIEERLAAWRHKLSSEDQQRVLAWAQRLSLDTYDAEPLPHRLRATLGEAPR
ncbi:MAG: sulfotransferase [Caldilineae bacterium]|nr:MAG: sulfotransferase [Caldilineae bacterium]